MLDGQHIKSKLITGLLGGHIKNPPNKREKGLLKGAMRRLFGRSDLRRSVIENAIIKGHKDPARKAVKFWVKCESCGQMEAKSNVQVDHRKPLVPVGRTLEDMTWDGVVDRLWCDASNLQILCKPCHKEKTKAENKERRLLKKNKVTVKW